MSMRKPAFGLLHQLAGLIARAASIGLFLFWGAFFVEHLAWFTQSQAWPPPEVWALQGLHLTLLAGYVLALMWDRLGCVLIAVGAILFFGLNGGANALLFALVSLTPIPFYVVARLNRPTLPAGR